MTSVQEVVQLSTVVILALTIVLSLFITREYIVKKMRVLLFWSSGLWMFCIGVFIEILFAFGIYNAYLANAYLLTVALLVEFLAVGSIQLVKSVKIRRSYYIFCFVSTLFLLYTLAIAPNVSIINQYRIAVTVTSTLVAISSSIVTFPAAVALVVVALLSYMKTKSKKMISIIAGVVVVSVAGTLYIAAVPVFLYYSEFAGIVLLWLGFFDLRMLKRTGKRAIPV